MANTVIRIGYISLNINIGGGSGGAGFEEYPSLSLFPPLGEADTIYVAIDTNKTYRWSGSIYVEISPSEVISVNTKVGAVVLDKTDIGLSNVDNTSDADKPISDATQDALDLKYDASNPAGYVTSAEAAAAAPVQSVNTKVGAVVLDKTDIGLSNVDNTSDIDKPISTATQTEIDTRITPFEEESQFQRYYLYENNAEVYADAEPGIKDPTGALRDGWYYYNQNAGEKINWYFFDGTTQGTVTLGDVSGYAVMTFDSTASAPIIAVYSFPTGTGDIFPGFAHSRVVYDGPMVPAPVTNQKYVVYFGENPPIFPELPRIQLSYVAATSAGDQDPSEIVLTLALGSNSSEPVGDVQYMVEHLGVYSPTVKQNAQLRIRVASQLDLDTHVSDTTNPHSVTASQVGLGNVDNTSDLNKPISTATQNALNEKVSRSGDTMSGNLFMESTSNPLNTSLHSSGSSIYNSDDGVEALSGVINGGSLTLQKDNGVLVSGAVYAADQAFITIDGEAFIPTLDEQLTTKKYVDSEVSNISGITFDILEDTKEPTGFVDRSESTTSFNDGTLEFSIAPVGASFSFYIKGVKYTKETPQTLTIPNSDGNHYIYFDANGDIASTQVFSLDIIEQFAFVSIIYWNTSTNSHVYFAEERHGITMDGVSHAYLHTVFGARYLSGLALQGFSVDGDGSSNTHAQFTADSGSIRDEDLLLTSAAQTQIPILYRIGDHWRKKPADNFPLIYNDGVVYTGARIPYNQFTGGAWQLTPVDNNKFVLVHFFASNDKENPIVGIQGINQYNDVPSARIAANTEITTLSGLPFAEFVPIGTVVFQTGTFTNTVNAIVRSVDGANYVDFRGTQLYTPAGEATEHSLLSGLADDDHIQYHTDARGDARYNLKSVGDISESYIFIANNQTSATDITGLVFQNVSTRSFSALVSVEIIADTNLYEIITINGIQKETEWDISLSSVGDISGIGISITNSGQLQYISDNYSGFVSGIIKFKAFTTSV